MANYDPQYPPQANPLDVNNHPDRNMPPSVFGNMYERSQQQKAWDSIDMYNTLSTMGTKKK